jgi:small subunit ribosomal protein S20
VANIKSAQKRAKQTVVRNARNNGQRSMLRTAVKKVLKALDANDAAGAQAAFAVAQPILDRFSCRPPDRASPVALKNPASAGFFLALAESVAALKMD